MAGKINNLKLLCNKTNEWSDINCGMNDPCQSETLDCCHCK